MPTKRVPTLDGSGLLPDKFIPGTIARVANVLAAGLRGVANGVAPLDSAGKLPVDNVPPASVLSVHYNGVAWPASRPTARTDVTILIDAPEGTVEPTWKLAHDVFETY